MEYHSFIDPEGNYIGKTKYINGEFIPLPPERVIEDKIPTLSTTKIRCPKTCNFAYNKK